MANELVRKAVVGFIVQVPLFDSNTFSMLLNEEPISSAVFS